MKLPTDTTTKRHRGRPRSDHPRSTGLLLKLNEAEAEKINQKARESGKPRAAWIRDILLAA